ncbi:multidrug and toxin extrusion protein 1-like isoform X4 [Synchiropus splendidus]|uniref:multidrug and toxin extrusion protein 1-like isoform X4 n=1 Tax=Synchiropus splendidus TaxID=270530 RepID=UPI00237DDE00|nr:multidrug and toxin extrusion protein 1-like isoform X4 [Synchiropus splendidus]
MVQSRNRPLCSAWRSVSQRARMLLPVGFQTEMKETCKLAGPVMISGLMGLAVGFVSTVFCGHLGKIELAAVSLAIAGIIWPAVVTGLVVNVLNALINYIVLFVYELGVRGSAIANLLSQYLMAVVLYGYILWRGLHKSTWKGWSRECLEDWGQFMHLAIPSLLMVCVEWWTYEIGGFLAGIISEVELGAQSVVYQISNVAYMFPMGFSVAGCVRVGNALGAGDTEQAKLSAKISMFSGVSVSVILAVLVGSLKNYVSFVFTYDEQIRQRVSDVVSFYAPFLLLDATVAVSGGVIRGAGKQKVGAICYILGYYGIGLPIGVPLMFAAKMGIVGLWTGILTCVFLQCIFLNVYLFCMNWRTATVEAQIRAGVCTSVPDADELPHSASQDNLLELVEAEEDAVAPPTQMDDITFRKLLVRRGMVLVLMLFVLAAGIGIKLLLSIHIT